MAEEPQLSAGMTEIIWRLRGHLTGSRAAEFVEKHLDHPLRIIFEVEGRCSTSARVMCLRCNRGRFEDFTWEEEEK